MWGLLPTFATPLAVSAGLTAALILWLFFRRSQQKVRKVGFHWRGLFFDHPPKPPPKAWPPLWLWALLLAVFFLTLAASQPLRHEPDDRPEYCVVLLETGVESQSREQGNRSRLEHLVDALVGLAKQKPARDRFLLITAGMEPSESDEWLSASELIRHLKEVRPTDGPTDWQAAFDCAEVHLGRTGGTLIVAAGTPRKQYQTWLNANELEHRPHVFVRAGRSAPNAGIESIAVFQSPFAQSTQALEVHARLRAFGSDQERRMVVRLNGEVVCWDIDGREVREWPVRISCKQAMTFPLTGIPQPGRLEIQLLPTDDQPADDLARAVIPDLNPLRVGFLSSDSGAKSLLERLPGLEVVPLAIDQEIPFVDLCVVDRRVVPAENVPTVNCLVFAGPGNPVDAVLLGMHDLHPLCKGVGSPDVRAFQAWLSDTPGADVAMVGAESDANALPVGFPRPVVWTVSRQGQRIVGFAFNPFDFDYRRYRKMPLLLLNAIEWLAPSSNAPLAVQLGAQPEFLSDPRTLIWDAAATEDSSTPGPDSQPIGSLENAGFYRATAERHVQLEFAANAPARPIVGESGSAVAEAVRVAAQAPLKERQPIDFWLWIVGTSLLLLELLLYLKDTVTWGGPFGYFSNRRLLREAARYAGQRGLEKTTRKSS